MTGMTQQRKHQTGEPTNNGGHFGSKTHTAATVALGPRTEEEWGRSIETPAELEAALRQEMDLFEFDAGSLDFTADDYGQKLHAVTERYVEHFADVVTRLDGVTSDEADDLFLRIVGPKMTDRIAKFNATWRPVIAEDGTVVIKQGAWNDDKQRTFGSAEDAEAAAVRENARIKLGQAYSRVARKDPDWDADFYPEDLGVLDAFAEANPSRVQNVTAVNLWFGMVRFDILQGRDEVVIEDNRRAEHVKDMLKSDRTLALRLDPDVVRSAGTFDNLAHIVGNTDEHFGTLIGAAKGRDGKFIGGRVSANGTYLSTFAID